MRPENLQNVMVVRKIIHFIMPLGVCRNLFSFLYLNTIIVINTLTNVIKMYCPLLCLLGKVLYMNRNLYMNRSESSFDRHIHKYESDKGIDATLLKNGIICNE